MRSTHSLLPFAAAGLLACGAEAVDTEFDTSTSGAVVTHQVWNGGQASASLWDEFSNTSLNVYENSQPGGERYAWADYYRNWTDPTSYVCETVTSPCKCPRGQPCPPDYQCTWEWCWYTRYGWEYGWGNVDPSSFRASGNRASFDAVLAASENFVIEQCSVDEEAMSWNCLSGEGGGAVSLDWRANNQDKESWFGTNQGRWGAYAYTFNGQGSGSSADVEGSLFGEAPTWGRIGFGHNVTIDRQPATSP